jgi:hypothetical protein
VANIDHPLMLHFGERDHTTPPENLVGLRKGQYLPASRKSIS